MTALHWSGSFFAPRPGSFPPVDRLPLSTVAALLSVLISIGLSACSTVPPRSSVQEAQAARDDLSAAAETWRLEVIDSRTTAEEAGADGLFPNLYTSVQAEFNASMDAEEGGGFEAAIAGYQGCVSLYGTLARLADAYRLRDELAAEDPSVRENPDWLAAGGELEAGIGAFLNDDRLSSDSAEEALAIYMRLQKAPRSP